MLQVKQTNLQALLVIWAIIGFPFVALLSNTFGFSSTALSLFFRAVIVLAALILFANYFRVPRKAFEVLFFTFWIFYISRMFASTVFFQSDLSRNLEFYWIWGLGACFLPAAAIICSPRIQSFESWRRILLVCSAIALPLALLIGTTTMNSRSSGLVDIGRLNTASLNPISMGNMAATSVLVALATLASPSKTGRQRLICFFVIPVGLVVLALANSRGPLLAFFVAIGVLVFAGFKRRSTMMLGCSLIVVLGVAIYLQREFIFGETGIIFRFQAIWGGVDQSASGRFQAFSGAWKQFLSSPLFGDALEERETGFYPHNLVLEALMATGILGGVPFIFLNIMALKRAWNLMRNRAREMWIGLLVVQYIVSSMFSGSLYGANTLWVLIALILSLPKSNRKTI